MKRNFDQLNDVAIQGLLPSDRIFQEALDQVISVVTQGFKLENLTST